MSMNLGGGVLSLKPNTELKWGRIDLEQVILILNQRSVWDKEKCYLTTAYFS